MAGEKNNEIRTKRRGLMKMLGVAAASSALPKTQAQEELDESNRVWPIRTNAHENCTSGTDKPTTGKGAIDWLVYDDCGSWKEYLVVPGETYYINVSTDYSKLIDARHQILEEIDGDWTSMKLYHDGYGHNYEDTYQYTPTTDRIRIVNIGVRGFYLRVYGESATPTQEPKRQLAHRYAPIINFDEEEKWYPTDPRKYAVENGDGVVASGVKALNEYTQEINQNNGEPPDPTVFYDVKPIGTQESPIWRNDLIGITYWFYYVFDQFTVNFHWHDSEKYHIFVDMTEVSDESEIDESWAVLYVADPHADMGTNNEYLDQDNEIPNRIHLLSELGSHGNCIDTNNREQRFERFSDDNALYRGTELEDKNWSNPDVTNGGASPKSYTGKLYPAKYTEVITDAYGLPRDEPYQIIGKGVVAKGYLVANPDFRIPGLNGEPLYESDGVSNDHKGRLDITESDLITEDPGPRRNPDNENSLVPPESDEDGYEYTLVSATKVEDTIDTFNDYNDEKKERYGLSDKSYTPTLDYDLADPRYIQHVVRAIEDSRFSGIIEPPALIGSLETHTVSVGDPWDDEWWYDPSVSVDHGPHRAALNQYRGVDLDLPLKEGLETKVEGYVTTLTSKTSGVWSEMEGFGSETRNKVKEVSGDVRGYGKSALCKLGVVSTPRVYLLDGDGEVVGIPPNSNGLVSARPSLETNEVVMVVEGDRCAPYIGINEVSGGLNALGARGNIPLVDEEEAVLFVGEVDEEMNPVTRVEIEGDSSGYIWDSKPFTDNSFARYLSFADTYTVTVTNHDGEKGMYRVDPDEDDDVVEIRDMEVGSGSLLGYVDELVDETRVFVRNELRSRDRPLYRRRGWFIDSMLRSIGFSVSFALWMERRDKPDRRDMHILSAVEKLDVLTGHVEKREERYPEVFVVALMDKVDSMRGVLVDI